jgi:hypothetical protein
MSSSGTVKIDETFTFEGGKQRYETKNAWAEVAIKKDTRRGDYYIDALIGARGSGKAHIHMGANADGSIRFLLPRGKLHSLGRRVVDSKRGVLEDKTVMLKPELGKKTFKFTVEVSEPKRQIKVLFADAKLA